MAETSPDAENLDHTISERKRALKEKQLIQEKRKQPGIGFPSAGAQKHLLIIRLNLAPPPPAQLTPAEVVSGGLRRLCTLLAQYDNGTKLIDVLDEHGNPQILPLSEFHFSATIGFGIGFFDLLNIREEKRPKKLRAMPDHQSLGDVTPYSLGQTDMIIQLGASEDFVNRWVLENVLRPIAQPKPGEPAPEAEDIVSAVAGWATITDVHAGFQRLDGRNLQGFNDGVSNPRRLSPLFDELVWTTEDGEERALIDGTYMVFQKIIHDLDQWRALDLEKQQLWVGRSKGTGLLLGTFSKDEDEKLASGLRSHDAAERERALDEWEPKFEEQANPQARLYDHEGGALNGKPLHDQIPNQCPAWSHVRKANPRQEDNKFPKQLIFRRGYPFMENGIDHKLRSGLLFVSFQRDIEQGFEFIKKRWFGNQRFPVPLVREFTELEKDARHRRGRFHEQELRKLSADQRKLLGLSDDAALDQATAEAQQAATQETGREGFAGPSEDGVNPSGEFLAIVPLGGGYYFCPPIPNRDPSQIGQQFFDFGSSPSRSEPKTIVQVPAVNGSSIDTSKEDDVTQLEGPKVTKLGSYLIIARYNREKWNRLPEAQQRVAQQVSLGLFPIQGSKKPLPNNGIRTAIADLAGDPLEGVRLLHTFHTGIFATLAEVEEADKEAKPRPPKELKAAVNELFGIQEPPSGVDPKDPGIGWLAIVEAASLEKFIGRMGSKGGPLWNLYDIEIISLNNDQSTEDIYVYMTPVSWGK